MTTETSASIALAVLGDMLNELELRLDAAFSPSDALLRAARVSVLREARERVAAAERQNDVLLIDDLRRAINRLLDRADDSDEPFSVGDIWGGRPSALAEALVDKLDEI
jgi:hypothetical protein